MNLYDRYLMPLLIDAGCGLKDFQALRALLLPQAAGAVLEIGIGTGRNLPFYDPARVSSLQGLDPAGQMHRKAQTRAKAAGLEVELIALSAEQIPAPDASYDTVVCTFTLCTIPDPVTALREMRRVLKTGGKLLFCEHGRAPEAPVQRWQDRLTPWWKPHRRRLSPEPRRAGDAQRRRLRADANRVELSERPQAAGVRDARRCGGRLNGRVRIRPVKAGTPEANCGPRSPRRAGLAKP